MLSMAAALIVLGGWGGSALQTRADIAAERAAPLAFERVPTGGDVVERKPDGGSPRPQPGWMGIAVAIACGVSAIALMAAVRRQSKLLVYGQPAMATVTSPTATTPSGTADTRCHSCASQTAELFPSFAIRYRSWTTTLPASTFTPATPLKPGAISRRKIVNVVATRCLAPMNL
jgi:hypothetical protein